jgi:TolB-like protein
VVLYIEDVARADQASQRLLSAVQSRLSTAVMFLMTARTGDQETTPAFVELASGFLVRRLKLQALSLRDIEGLLSSMLELPPGDRQRLAQRLYAQSGGNPFYAIELTAAMVDEELLTPTESGAWRLAESESGLIPLPASIREAVGRRLERLPAATRQVLESAAVLGMVFDAALVPSVAGISPIAAAAALEELIGRRMVRAAADPAGWYEFTHEIIGRVAYDLLSSDRREALHRAAARSYQANARRSQPARAAREYHAARSGHRPARWRRRLVLIATTVALVLGTVVAVTPAAQRARLVTLLTRHTPAMVPNRIVIAPLVNQTGDTALAGLGTLAAEYIADGLMRTTQFEVVDPRTSIIAGRIVRRIPSILRDRNPAVALAEETGAGTVISGDLYREGDSLRVLVRVIDAGSG